MRDPERKKEGNWWNPMKTLATRSNGGLLETGSATWTAAENKRFENALALYDRDTPDRWQRVAAMIPGKSAVDVMRQYQDLENDITNIEAGLFPIPAYDYDAAAAAASPFTLDLVNSHAFNNGFVGLGLGKRPSSSTRTDLNPERKKGVPWTEEEHKLFLMGLKKYGKGDWRNISRSYVVTRTPTQVASHAQKYFIRQLSGGKDKRRASIHDITTVDTQNHSLDNSKGLASQEQLQPNSGAAGSLVPFQWNQSGMGPAVCLDGSNANMPPYGMDSYGLIKAQGLNNLHRGGGDLESYIEAQRMLFQLQSRQNYPCG